MIDPEEFDRAFFCVRRGTIGSLLSLFHDPELPRVEARTISDAALLLWSILDAADARHRVFTDGPDYVAAVRCLVGKSDSRLRAWSPDRINSALHLLRARGFLVWHSVRGQEHLALAREHWPRTTSKVARKGKPPPDDQPTLPISGGIAAMRGPPNDRRREQNTQNESARERSDSGTRALSLGNGDSDPDEMVGCLGVQASIIGLSEAVKNRGLWITCYNEAPVAFREANGECLLKKRDGFAPRETWAAVWKATFNRIRDERRAA